MKAYCSVFNRSPTIVFLLNEERKLHALLCLATLGLLICDERAL